MGSGWIELNLSCYMYVFFYVGPVGFIRATMTAPSPLFSIIFISQFTHVSRSHSCLFHFPLLNPPPKPKPTPAPTPSLFKFLHTTTSTSPTFPSLSKLWGLINYRFLISIYTHIYMITILSISKSKRTTQTWTPQKTGLSQ